jgi:hypothetical protein
MYYEVITIRTYALYNKKVVHLTKEQKYIIFALKLTLLKIRRTTMSIHTHKDYINEFSLRNQEKNISGLLQTSIFNGTNCSQFETKVIVAEIMNTLRLHTTDILHPGQILYTAVSSDEGAGKSLKECKKVSVKLTLIDEASDVQTTLKERRQNKILRLTDEALDQGALLTQEDLSNLLNTDVRTIRRDVKTLLERGENISLRGIKKDIGRSISHKRKIIEKYLSGKTPVDLINSTHHSLTSIERYLSDFKRVCFLYRKKIEIDSICQIAKVSKTLAEEYISIYEAHSSNLPKYNRILALIVEKSKKKLIKEDVK